MYLRDTGLVIGPQEGRTVGGDQSLADIVEHLREFRRLQCEPLYPFQGNLPTVIFLDNLRLDIGSGSVRGCVHVGYEADGRDLLPYIGRDLSHYVSIFIQGCLHSKLEEFVPKQSQEVQLLRRGRLTFRILVALRVHRHIP